MNEFIVPIKNLPKEKQEELLEALRLADTLHSWNDLFIGGRYNEEFKPYLFFEESIQPTLVLYWVSIQSNPKDYPIVSVDEAIKLIKRKRALRTLSNE